MKIRKGKGPLQKILGNKKSKSLFHLIVFVAIYLLPYFIFQYFSFTYSGALALLFSTIILWFFEWIPLPVTAFLIPVMGILYGIVDTAEAFRPFGNQILFLFIGSFLLAIAMNKQGLDKRLSYYILSLKFFQRSLEYVIFVISLLSWVLSMWISNTAACAILTPISLALITSLKDQFTDKKKLKNFKLRILFTCAFSASIGGMATPIGSPPNLLAIEFLAKKNIIINFFDWPMIGLPVSFIMILVLHFLLRFKYPIEKISLKGINTFLKSELSKLGKIKIAEIQIIFCFLVAVSLWLAPGIVKIFSIQSQSIHIFLGRLPMGAVAILASSLLFIFPINAKGDRNLNWENAKEIDWGTVILFGGGLTLGFILSQSGLALYLGQKIFSSSLSSQSMFFAGGISIILAIILSEFGSNTASATIILPILMGTFSHLPLGPLTHLIMAATFGASFGFMLPVSTPPNAIIYASGMISVKDMVKTGIYFDILGLIVIYFFMFYF